MRKHIENQVKKRVKGEARKKKQLRKAEINADGSETLDETPLFVEIGQRPEKSMDQKIREITAEVQATTLAKIAAQNMTEEQVQAVLDEENDFTIPEEVHDVLTVYEAQGLVSDLEEQVVIQAEPTAEPDVSGQDEPSTSTSTAEQPSGDVVAE